MLAGSAGTGKTSVLGILCDQGAIRQDGLLLLAPTGKARVRMQELAGEANTQAMTLAQFLNRNDRYDGHPEPTLHRDSDLTFKGSGVAKRCCITDQLCARIDRRA